MSFDVVIQRALRRFNPSLVFGGVLLSLLNVPVVSLLRLSDIFLLLTYITNTRVLVVFLGFVTVTLFHSMMVMSGTSGMNLFWLYKITFFLCSIFTITQAVSRNTSTSVKVLFILFGTMIGWVYIRLFLVSNGFIGGGLRVSFIGGDPAFSDAHLYSQSLTLLGICVCIVNSFRLKNYILINLIILIILIPSLILTSSRNGILVLFLVAVLYLALRSAKVIQRLRLRTTIVWCTLFLVCLIYGASFFVSDFKIDEDVFALIYRALFTLSTSDASTSTRIAGFIDVLGSDDIAWGHGILFGRLGFYDGTVTLFVALFGIIGTSLIIAIFYIFIAQIWMRGLYYSTFGILIYFGQNLISEFFLVSRGGVISLFCLSVVYYSEKNTKNLVVIP